VPHTRHDGLVLEADAEAAIPVRLVDEASFETAFADAGNLAAPSFAVQALAQDFKAQAGRLAALTLGDGSPAFAYGLGKEADAFALRGLAGRLPPGTYRLAPQDGFPEAEAALAFALGSYVFDRYRADHGKPRPRLLVADTPEVAEARRIAAAAALAKDLVNTPANDMGPRQIETVAQEIAEAHGASLSVVVGEALLDENYPAVHAVGRAAAPHRAPRMIELSWTGPGAGPQAPKVALVGKGVVFDTGGLDLKPSSAMRNMKKDMGGAAHALALARLVMQAGLPVRLSVLVPAVENAVSGDAMRPGDILATRKGLTVEVGNTDAEGRLILADALTRAAELAPDLTLDLATLTGAARAALGPEVVPFYTDDETLAGDLAAASLATHDPLWRLPLWKPYEEGLTGDIADLKNDPDGWVQAGSVAAALFLKRFAPTTGAWAHFDIFAWNPRARPGWPAGAEAQAIRAIFALLQRRYGARA
jgi:leucyl aminopeptidase